MMEYMIRVADPPAATIAMVLMMLRMDSTMIKTCDNHNARTVSFFSGATSLMS